MTAPRVLLAALDPARNASRVPAMLAAGGVRPVVLAPRDTSLAHSWCIDRFVAVERDDERAVAAVRNLVTRERFDLTIIADEAMLLALASRLQPWMAGVLPFGIDAATCASVLDKNRMLAAMRDRDIALPPSEIVRSAGELAAAAERIGYPLLLKDAVGCGGAGIRRVDTPGQLMTAHASLAPAGDVTVQRFMRARSGCTDVLFDRGVPRCWTSAYMMQQWPTPFDPATVRVPVSVAAVEPMLRAVGDATGFHGLGGVDWIEDERGALFFLEFNARVTHVVGPARPAFGREIGAMLSGAAPAPHELRLPAQPIPIFPAHFIRALKARPLELLQWLPLRSSSADLDWRDAGVLGAELGAIVTGALGRLRRSPARPIAANATAPPPR